MHRPRVLFAASEIFPFAKTGGLADVAYSLPRAMRAYADIEAIMPLYASIDRKRYGIEPLGDPFWIGMGERRFRVRIFGCKYGGVLYRFVYESALCDRPYLYGPPGEGYDDNAIRFGLFCRAIVRYAVRGAFDLLHLNDWQTALAALYLSEEKPETAAVFTIHNLAYQGVFDASQRAPLGLEDRHFTMDGVEFYGGISFMKAGIRWSGRVTTVSPTYASEILTPEFGCGLEGFLRYHRDKLSGILNGIDEKQFSPQRDRALAASYDSPRGKRPNKAAYLREAGLPGTEEKPLFIFIGRFAAQKGLDLLIEALPRIVQLPCNVAILGEGESRYRSRLSVLASQHENLHLALGYDEELSHRMYAAADFLLMPSLFEPCGLNQMIAMRYGTLPVVRRTGGLADTVADVGGTETPVCGRGFCFGEKDADALVGTVQRAVRFFGRDDRYMETAAHDMACDFSWNASAKKYAELYRETMTGER